MLKISNQLRFYYKTFYQLLEVPQNASSAQIKSSYLRIVKLYHSDTKTQESKNQEYFKQVTAAYQILSNESERQKYDQAINNEGHSSYNSQNSSQKENDQTSNYVSILIIIYFRISIIMCNLNKICFYISY
ncbi:unnamed protein product [Paramecium sonneborni]|uniref:J domain-containing protein n=1 Tax=Paramecium sonneborni TaxID=65129 RepID=A0A8S1RPT7_9CILI|nr:unnamed protein product [Paramecium sonneborni]